MRLLADLRNVFGDAEKLPTNIILGKLHLIDDAPWGDMRGNKMTDAQLSKRLRPYDIKPKSLRIGGEVLRGYARADFHETWKRYLPPLGTKPATHATPATDG